jgi:hypothetical protein
MRRCVLTIATLLAGFVAAPRGQVPDSGTIAGHVTLTAPQRIAGWAGAAIGTRARHRIVGALAIALPGVTTENQEPVVSQERPEPVLVRLNAGGSSRSVNRSARCSSSSTSPATASATPRDKSN